MKVLENVLVNPQVPTFNDTVKATTEREIHSSISHVRNKRRQSTKVTSRNNYFKARANTKNKFASVMS